MQMLRSRERLPTRRETTAELLLTTIIGALGARRSGRGDGGRTSIYRRHLYTGRESGALEKPEFANRTEASREE